MKDATTIDGPDATPTIGKDATTTVGPDATPNIGKDATTTAGPDATPIIVKDATTIDGPDATPTIGKDATTTAGPDATPIIVKDATTIDGPDATPTIGKDATTTVGPDATPTIGKDATTTAGPDATPTIGKDATTTVGPDATPTIGKDSTTTAKDSTTTASSSCQTFSFRLTAWEVLESCSCFCGNGTEKISRKCIWYELDSKSNCVERVDMTISSNHCNNSILETSRMCSQEVCVISALSHLTSDKRGADTDNAIHFRAYAKDGSSCDIGNPAGEDYTRERGELDIFQLNLNCPDICLVNSSDTFSYLEATTDGYDSWEPEYIELNVLGIRTKYYAAAKDKRVDDRATVQFSKSV